MKAKEPNLFFGFIPKQVATGLHSQDFSARMDSARFILAKLPLSFKSTFDVSSFINFIKVPLYDDNLVLTEMSTEILSSFIARLGPEICEINISHFVEILAPLICNFKKSVGELGRTTFRHLIVISANPKKAFDELAFQTTYMLPVQRCELLSCFSDLLDQKLIKTKFLLNYTSKLVSFLTSKNEVELEKVKIFLEKIEERDPLIFEYINKQKEEKIKELMTENARVAFCDDKKRDTPSHSSHIQYNSYHSSAQAYRRPSLPLTFELKRGLIINKKNNKKEIEDEEIEKEKENTKTKTFLHPTVGEQLNDKASSELTNRSKFLEIDFKNMRNFDEKHEENNENIDGLNLKGIQEEIRASTHNTVRDMKGSAYNFEKAIFTNNDFSDFNDILTINLVDDFKIEHTNINTNQKDIKAKSLTNPLCMNKLQKNQKPLSFVSPPIKPLYNTIPVVNKSQKARLINEENMKKASNSPNSSLIVTIDKIFEILSNPDKKGDSWNEKNDTVLLLQKNLKSYEKEIDKNLRNIVVSLLECASSPRTILAKNSLDCLNSLLSVLNIDFNPIADMLATNLLQLVTSNKKFITDLASNCFFVLMEKILPVHAAQIFERESRRKHQSSRLKIAQGISILIGKVTNPSIFISTIEHLAQDPNQDVRKYAKEAAKFCQKEKFFSDI